MNPPAEVLIGNVPSSVTQKRRNRAGGGGRSLFIAEEVVGRDRAIREEEGQDVVERLSRRAGGEPRSDQWSS